MRKGTDAKTVLCGPKPRRARRKGENVNEQKNGPAQAETAPDFRDKMLEDLLDVWDRLHCATKGMTFVADSPALCSVSATMCNVAQTALALRKRDLSAWFQESSGSSRTAS